MARRSARPQPDRTLELPTLTRTCPACGGPLWAAYMTERSVATLDGIVRLRLQVRRCRAPLCPRLAAPTTAVKTYILDCLRTSVPPMQRAELRLRGQAAARTAARVMNARPPASPRRR